MADRINIPATDSKEAASYSDKNNASIKGFVNKIEAETDKLLDIVAGVNSRTQGFAASTEQIAASTEELTDTVERVREELKELELASKEK